MNVALCGDWRGDPRPLAWGWNPESPTQAAFSPLPSWFPPADLPHVSIVPQPSLRGLLPRQGGRLWCQVTPFRRRCPSLPAGPWLTAPSLHFFICEVGSGLYLFSRSCLPPRAPNRTKGHWAPHCRGWGGEQTPSRRRLPQALLPQPPTVPLTRPIAPHEPSEGLSETPLQRSGTSAKEGRASPSPGWMSRTPRAACPPSPCKARTVSFSRVNRTLRKVLPTRAACRARRLQPLEAGGWATLGGMGVGQGREEVEAGQISHDRDWAMGRPPKWPLRRTHTY